MLEERGELQKDELLVRVGERVDAGVRTIQIALEELRAAGVISMRGGYRGVPISYFFKPEEDGER